MACRSSNGGAPHGLELGRVMPTDRIDIRHVAKLARLALSDGEIATFGPQLGSLMTHVDALAELDTENVPATAQVVPSRNVQREDAVRPETMLSREAALQNAPETLSGFFRVPRILAEEG
jgi:aspartyl-tRNA(Asn)/glutamyl-tRNA(Gln) amidotransferase subunit C